MQLDLTSFMFGIELKGGTGTPAWGTALGQGLEKKLNPHGDAFYAGLIYSSIEDINNVACPLGKGGAVVVGGQPNGKFSIDLASKFDKIYVNGQEIRNASFVLLVTKEKESVHAGRRTLKYNIKITYNDIKINEECVRKMMAELGLKENSAWFVYDIDIVNQDELHFSVLIVDKKHTKIYENSDERKKDFERLLSESNIISNIDIDDETLTPEWFKSQEYKYVDEEKRAEKLRDEFNRRFGKEAINDMGNDKLLEELFLHNPDTNNMCYLLEYDNEYRIYFGSIRGGSSSKHKLYFGNKIQKWQSNKDTTYTLEEARAKAGEIRNNMVAGYDYIKDNLDKFENLSFYDNLYDELSNRTNGLINNVTYCKYYHMMFPKIIPCWYTGKWIDKVLKLIGLDTSGNFTLRWGRIQHFINECDISDTTFSLILRDYFHSHNNEDYDGEEDDNKGDEMKEKFSNFKSGGGTNLVIYGTPGCGKSFKLNEFLNTGKDKDNDLFGLTLKEPIKESFIIRTTFHRDYSNTDFVGQIVPEVEDGSAEYKINPGPFTIALEKAFENPDENIALVIEELNRGDAAGIFGDIFQLLDRYKDDKDKEHIKGVSQYPIENSLIQSYLIEHTDYKFDSIKIPSNLYIFATMNTSDQNVFTLDTAFKRRWDFVKLKNDTNKFKNDHGDLYVPGSKTLWIDFVEKLNKEMINLDGNINEDKQLGLYFVDLSLLEKKEDREKNENEEGLKINKRKFAYKLLEYLWNDVVRYDKGKIFKITSDINTLDDLIDEFCKDSEDSLNIFSVDVK